MNQLNYLKPEVVQLLKQNTPLKRRPLFDIFSRGADLILSFFFIILTFPVMLIVALAVKLTDGGPVFYVQKRTGIDGKAFGLMKFRSMVVGADRLGAKWRSYNNDNRFTKIGKLIREYHLDELPQFFNVIKGNMSIVGPRPALTFHIDFYEPWEKVRAAVRPGLTGLSQVSGGNVLSWDERIIIDVFYVRNRNFGLYFLIIIRTFLQLFYRKGIHGRGGVVKGWTRGLPTDYHDDTMEKK